jgi:hypothetical protein
VGIKEKYRIYRAATLTMQAHKLSESVLYRTNTLIYMTVYIIYTRHTKLSGTYSTSSFELSHECRHSSAVENVANESIEVLNEAGRLACLLAYTKSEQKRRDNVMSLLR